MLRGDNYPDTGGDLSDDISFAIIHVSDGINHGQFIFDQKILISKGVMSKNNQDGKRAIRVYPAWTTPIAKDAIKTQAWQLKYFLPLKENIHADLAQVKKFFNSAINSQEHFASQKIQQP